MIADYVDLIVRVTDESGIANFPIHASRLIAMAEVDLNRRLRVAEMEVTTTLTTDANGEATLPSDFEIERDLYITKYDRLDKTTLQDFNTENPRKKYVIKGNTLVTTEADTDIILDYYQSIPSLQANSTNWLLTKDPELYLLSVMLQAYKREARRLVGPEPEAAQAMMLAAQASSAEVDRMVDMHNDDDKGRRMTRTIVHIGGYTP